MKRQHWYVLPIVLLAASIALAAVPQQITYQGRLTESGSPVTGSRNVTFRLYNTAGTQIWSSGSLTVTCTSGLFAVQLGAPSQPVLPVALFNDTGITVGITVGTGTELTPRTRLSSVAFGYHALIADTANVARAIGDNSISSTKIINGSIQLIDIAQNGATTGQVIKWNGTGWVVANDSAGTSSGGDITAVTAGTRLSGGGTSGDVTLHVDTAGLTTYYSRTSHTHTLVDSATAAARATTAKLADSAKTVRVNSLDSANIRNGSLTTDNIKNATLLTSDLAQNGAATGQVLKWDGGGWAAANDSVGSVGAFLPLSGGTLTGITNWDFPNYDLFIQPDGATTSLSIGGPIGTAARLSSDGNGLLTLRSTTDYINAKLSASPTQGGTLYLSSPVGVQTHKLGGNSGNSATVLPDSSISAPEILDEPGIAGSTGWVSDTLPVLVMTDLTTVTITIPAAGYIFLIGKCLVEFAPDTLHYGSQAFIQIDETAGGGENYTGARVWGGAFPSTHVYDLPVTVTNTYYKSAGTYTFRVEGMRASEYTCRTSGSWGLLTALYFPTSYGTVGSMVSSGEAGKFEKATPSGLPSDAPLFQVDLRELELKAAKAEAAAQKAKLELLQAQIEKER